MEVSDAERLKSLEEENTELKHLLAETFLDLTSLKNLLNRDR
jgi:putative transposase